MGWTTAQQARLETERTILRQYFPTLEWHHPRNSAKTYIEGPVRTNSRRSYRLRIYVPEAFPAACPLMVVADPVPLRDRGGAPLTEPSHPMHVLGAVDGATVICHYRPDLWVPDNTLYWVALKGRIWLEAYEAHLRTGNSLDTYLKHMGSGDSSSGTFGQLARRFLAHLLE
jgi:hypothetical protein